MGGADKIVGSTAPGIHLWHADRRGGAAPAISANAFCVGTGAASVVALLCTEVLGNDARAIRLVVWGIPAALLLASVVSLEDWLRARPIKWLVALGAWSYSLYLSHGFVVDFAWVVAAKLDLAHGLLIYAI
jgi:peptidoglycan/LPS O-acetylase OafA/YrhL